MGKSADYFKWKNRQTPVMPVRLPSPDHHDQVRAAASAEGISLSEWVRRAVARALADPISPSST